MKSQKFFSQKCHLIDVPDQQSTTIVDFHVLKLSCNNLRRHTTHLFRFLENVEFSDYHELDILLSFSSLPLGSPEEPTNFSLSNSF